MSQPLKIAMLVEATSAGVGRHVIDLGSGLIEAGHTLHIFYSGKRVDSRFERGISQLSGAGAECTRIDVHRLPHLSDLSAIRLLRRHLRQKGPFDIVHCHSTKAGLIGRAAAIGINTRTVYTPNAFITMSPAPKLAKAGAWAIEKLFANFSTGIICVSTEELEHAARLRLPADRLFLVPNGIDLSVIASAAPNRGILRSRFGLLEGDFCLGFVGRLSPQKDPAALVRSFALAIPNLPNSSKLVIVGDGPLRADVQSTISQLNLNQRVIMAGEMDGVESMAAFDAFALPSRYEGFPYVLIEAAASGLPIASTAVGGASTIVENGTNGFIVPIGDEQTLAEATTRIANDPALRLRMAAHSRRIAAQFSVGRMVIDTTSIYRALLAPPKISQPQQPVRPKSHGRPTPRTAKSREIPHKSPRPAKTYSPAEPNATPPQMIVINGKE